MRSNQKICQWMLAICACVLLLANLQAQNTNSAHRKLERPTGGSSDVQKQIELIKRLQTLMQNRSAQSAEEPEGLSSLQKSMMESVLKQFQNSDSLPDLSALPPELLGKMMADPQARQDAKEMLERFQKNRQLPEANGSGGLPLPPSENSPVVDSSQNGRQPQGDRPPQDRQQNSNGVRRPPRETDSRGVERQNSPSETSPANTNGQRKLNRPDDASNGPDDDFSNNRERQTAENNPPIRMPNEPESEYLDRYSEFVEREIERQRQQGMTEPLGKTELPFQPAPSPSVPGAGNSSQSFDSRPQRNSDGSRGADGRRNLRDQSDNQNQLPPTISDFLEELGARSELPSASEFEWPATPSRDGMPSPSASAAGSRNVPSPDLDSAAEEALAEQEARAQNAEQLAQHQQEIKEQLERTGLKSTLKKILQQARKEMKNRPATNNTTGNSSAGSEAGSGSGFLPEITPGMEKAIIRSLDSIGKDVLEFAKDAKDGKRKVAKDSSSSNTNTAAAESPSRPSPKPNDSGTSWGKKASDFISNVVAPTVDPKAAQSSSESSSSNDSASALPSVEFSWVPFVFLGILVLMAFAFAKKSGIIGGLSSEDSRLSGGLLPTGLKTREDVVKAFHELALKPGHDAESWWTHEQFKQQLKSRVQLEDHPIEVLAEVYEHARYLPDEATLNDQQLQQARVALERCEP